MSGDTYAIVPLGTSLFMPTLAWCLAPNVGLVDVTAMTVGSGKKGTQRGHGPAPELRALHLSPCLILAQSVAISHRCRNLDLRSRSSSQGRQEEELSLESYLMPFCSTPQIKFRPCLLFWRRTYYRSYHTREKDTCLSWFEQLD